MAKAIYALKIQLLYDGNECILNLRAKELRGLQRFNKFVVIVYIQSWYTCRSAADAAVNDIDLIRRMDAFDDDCIRATGLKAMLRHSWYLGQELAMLALFSAKLSTQQKGQLLQTMATPRGPHLLAVLPRNVSELRISRSFFASTGI